MVVYGRWSSAGAAVTRTGAQPPDREAPPSRPVSPSNHATPAPLSPRHRAPPGTPPPRSNRSRFELRILELPQDCAPRTPIERGANRVMTFERCIVVSLNDRNVDSRFRICIFVNLISLRIAVDEMARPGRSKPPGRARIVSFPFTYFELSCDTITQRVRFRTGVFV